MTEKKTPQSNDVRAAQQAFVNDTKRLLRDGLDAVDAHPVGHVVCELVRGNVRGEIRTGEDAVKIAFNAAFDMVCPEDLNPKAK